VQKRKGSRTTSQQRRLRSSAGRARSTRTAADNQLRPHRNTSKQLRRSKRTRNGRSHTTRTKSVRARPYADAIINAIHTPLVVLDEQSRVLSASRQFYRFFDCTPADTLSQRLADTKARNLDAPKLRALFDRKKDTSRALENFEMTIDVAPHGKRTLVVAIDEITDPGIQERRILLSFDDITDFKHTEQQLDAAKRVAEQANLLKSRFLAAASHDLRQPLQTLSLLHGTLKRLIKNDEPLTLLARADRTLDLMSDMLTKLLDINQLEAGAIRPHFTSFPIQETLDFLNSEFAELMRAKGLRWRVSPSSAIVRSDHRLLEEILRNLLTNALRYTDRGTVLLGCHRRGDKLSVEVWDSGIGISEHDMPRIFEEYHQAPDSRQRGGLGLGLAIVQNLGQLLNHPVRARSEVGKGSVFAIEVPTAPSHSKRETITTDVPGEAQLRLGTVLVIEDDTLVRESLELMLRKEGHRVIAAPNAEAALAHVSSGLRPDLVISDYTLSGTTTGTQVAANLRASLGWTVPVIILTGDIRAATFGDIAASGCINLSKPVTAESLSRVTQQCLAPLQSPPQTSDTTESTERATIYVVDDNRQTREALRVLLLHAGYRVKIYGTARAFLDSYRPGEKGCLITDLRMPGMGGFELLAQFAAAGHGLPSIVITGKGDIATAVQAMKAGAVDFIEKPTNPDTLLNCISRALQQVASPDEHSARRSAAALRLAALTARERQVLELVVAGHANKEIAYRLGISQRTVESHRATVMKKMGASSLSDLVYLEMDAR
jgi:two-component system, chemotaxis family, CheB/CheR fusion protein